MWSRSPSRLRGLEAVPEPNSPTEQDRDDGYSLAGIGDLLDAWRGGDALTDILCLEPDELVHVDDPVTLGQLASLLLDLVPGRLGELLDTGVVEACSHDHYCIPSPSLLQLTVDAIDAGIGPDARLQLLGSLRLAADAVLATLDALMKKPSSVSSVEDAVCPPTELAVSERGTPQA